MIISKLLICSVLRYVCSSNAGMEGETQMNQGTLKAVPKSVLKKKQTPLWKLSNEPILPHKQEVQTPGRNSEEVNLGSISPHFVI